MGSTRSYWSLSKTCLSPLNAHGGIAKTIFHLKTFSYWPKIVKQISEFVSSCEVCKQTKAPNQILRPPMDQPISVRPFLKLYLDLLGLFPANGDIIIVLVHLSKFHFLESIKQLNAQNILSFLKKRAFRFFFNYNWQRCLIQVIPVQIFVRESWCSSQLYWLLFTAN